MGGISYESITTYLKNYFSTFFKTIPANHKTFGQDNRNLDPESNLGRPEYKEVLKT